MKIAIYLSLGLHKGRPSYKRNLQPSKENIQHFKTWKFFTFFNFCEFWSSWIRIRQLKLNADAQPCSAVQGGTVPCALKREHPAFQNMKILDFFKFCESFGLSWIRIRIRQLKLMRIHKPALLCRLVRCHVPGAGHFRPVSSFPRLQGSQVPEGGACRSTSLPKVIKGTVLVPIFRRLAFLFKTSIMDSAWFLGGIQIHPARTLGPWSGSDLEKHHIRISKLFTSRLSKYLVHNTV